MLPTFSLVYTAWQFSSQPSQCPISKGLVGVPLSDSPEPFHTESYPSVDVYYPHGCLLDRVYRSCIRVEIVFFLLTLFSNKVVNNLVGQIIMHIRVNYPTKLAYFQTYILHEKSSTFNYLESTTSHTRSVVSIMGTKLKYLCQIRTHNCIHFF